MVSIKPTSPTHKILQYLLLVFASILVAFMVYSLLSNSKIKSMLMQNRFITSLSKGRSFKEILSEFPSNKWVSPTKQKQNAKEPSAVNKTPETNESTDKPCEWSQEILDRFKDDPNGFYFFEVGFGVKEISAFGDWDYTKTAFSADIISYDSQTREITLRVSSPTSMPYSGKTISALERCDPEQSYLGVGRVVVSSSDKFLKYIASGNTFIASCLDSECKKIGPFCKILLDQISDGI